MLIQDGGLCPLRIPPRKPKVFVSYHHGRGMPLGHYQVCFNPRPRFRAGAGADDIKIGAPDSLFRPAATRGGYEPSYR